MLCRSLLAALLLALPLLQPQAAQAHSTSDETPLASAQSTGAMQAGSMQMDSMQMGEDAVGAVYVLTNQLNGNGVAIFNRSEDGSLSEPTVVVTGGQGIASGLGSQGAIALSQDGLWLLAVNAGSNEISSLAVMTDGLKIADKVDSGGVRPISIAIYDDLVYVLNAGASGNISGFRLDDEGSLTPIAGSTRHVSNLGLGVAPLPAQVSFDPTGKMLVITERGSNLIDTYTIDDDGLAWGPSAQASAGMTPYGFAFTPGGTLVVSEAFGGAEDGSAVSSYSMMTDTLVVSSQSISTTQTAACWIAVSLDGEYAYSANAGSSSISSYSVGEDGTLTLLEGVAGMTGDGSAPVDMSISSDGLYLYVLSAKSQNVIAFAVQPDGSLELVEAFGGLPKGAGGIAAR